MFYEYTEIKKLTKCPKDTIQCPRFHRTLNSVHSSWRTANERKWRKDLSRRTYSMLAHAHTHIRLSVPFLQQTSNKELIIIWLSRNYSNEENKNWTIARWYDWLSAEYNSLFLKIYFNLCEYWTKVTRMNNERLFHKVDMKVRFSKSYYLKTVPNIRYTILTGSNFDFMPSQQKWHHSIEYEKLNITVYFLQRGVLKVSAKKSKINVIFSNLFLNIKYLTFFCWELENIIL